MFTVSPLITSLATLQNPKFKTIINSHLKTHHKKFGFNTTLTKNKHCLANVPIKVTLLTSNLSSCGLIYVTSNNINLQKDNVAVIIVIMNYW
jgi:hypothetical protein